MTSLSSYYINKVTNIMFMRNEERERIKSTLASQKCIIFSFERLFFEILNSHNNREVN